MIKEDFNSNNSGKNSLSPDKNINYCDNINSGNNNTNKDIVEIYHKTNNYID